VYPFFVSDTSQVLLKFIATKLTGAQNLGEQARPNDFAGMKRNYRCAAVGVSKEMVAPSDPLHFETCTSKNRDKLLAGRAGQLGHAAMVTR
jgi:hypothetical protein